MMKIEFGIGADLSGIKNAIAMLDKLSSKVVTTATRMKDAEKEKQKVYLRQETALKNAIQKTIELTTEMKRLGMSQSSIKHVAQRLEEFSESATKAGRNVQTLAREQQAFNSTLTNARSSMKSFKAGLGETTHSGDKAKDAMHALTNKMRNLESAAVLAVGPLSGIGARIRSLGAIMGRASWQTAAYIGVLVGVVVILGKLAQAAVRANQSYEKSMARLYAATGNVKAAGEEYQFIVKTARQLGLRIDVLAESYSKFAAAAKTTQLEGKGVRDMFLATSKAAASLRLDPQEVGGIFKALEQMISKGQIQAEEMRGQFGERLPGAFKLAADSMKMSTREMGEAMKKGLLTAEEVFPKIAVAMEALYGESAMKNAQSYQGTMNNMINAWDQFALAFDKTSKTSRGAILAMNMVTVALDTMRTSLKPLFMTLGITMTLLAANKWILSGNAILFVANAIRLAAVNMGLLNAAILLNPAGAALQTIVKVGTYIATAAAAYFAFDYWTSQAAGAVEDMNAELEYQAQLLAAETLTKSLQKYMDSIDDYIDSLVHLKAAREAIDDGVDPAFAMLRYAEAVKLAKASDDELYAITTRLSGELGMVLTPSIMGAATGFAFLAEDIRVIQEEIQKIIDLPNVFKDIRDQIKEVNAESQALTLGEAEKRFYDAVLKPMQEANDTLREANGLNAEGLDLLNQLEAALMRNFAAQEALNESKRMATKIARDDAAMTKAQQSNYVKLNKAYERAFDVMDLMAERNAALASGPESFRVYEKIERPLMVFRNQLEKVVDAQGKQLFQQGEINAMVEQYNALLQAQLVLTGPAVQAANEMGDAFGDAFEKAITGAESFKDSFKGMMEEIWRILARTLIIDPIVDQLKTGLQGAMANLTSGTQGTFPSIFSAGGLFGGKKQASSNGGRTSLMLGGKPGGASSTTPTLVAAQKSIEAMDKFDEVIDQFETAIERMAECCCACANAGGEGGSGMTEAAEALFRSSQEMGTTAYDLDSASGDLKSASYSLENTARSFEAAAMKDQQMQKADKWMKLIQTGVSAYSSMSSMGSGGDTAGSMSTASSSAGRTSFILGDNPNGMTPVTYSGMSMDEVNAILPGRARGGPTMRGGMYQVAEDGPELYHEGNKSYLLAGNDGQVEPIGGRGGREGGNTTNITIVMPQQTTNRTAAQNARAIGKEQARVMGRNS